MRDDKQIIDLIKDRVKLPNWVYQSRQTSNELNALVYGYNYHELLINRIEQLENPNIALAREKYSLDIRDLNERVMAQRNNVFSADGGAEHFAEINDLRKENIKKYLDDFKGGKSIDDYLADNIFRLSDVDPNGLIFLEYKANGEQVQSVYPTYKSIQDIQDYEPDGLKVKWVLFSPVDVRTDAGKIYKEWRYVDDARNVVVKDFGTRYEIDEKKTFDNSFKEVPATILSNIEKIGTNIRFSWLFFVQELYKKYAQDSSIKYIYEKLQGFPKHWRYVMMCNACRGTKQRDGKICKSCDGKGHVGSADVTDDIMLPLPTDSQNDVVVAPNISGFVSPDLETLKHMAESRMSLEDIITDTVWGTHKDRNTGGRETATARFIDTQPISNKLTILSNFVESTHNIHAGYVINLVDRLKTDVKETLYTKTYGKRFIIEGADVLAEKYGKAKQEGLPITVLDKMLSELISAKYKSDVILRGLMLKKSKVEPYVHLTIKEVSEIFGSEEAQSKVLFTDWWDNIANQTDSVENLIQEYKSWFNLNKTVKTEQEDGTEE